MIPGPGGGAIRLNTAAGCQLAIAAYPRFHYNAEGGGGSGDLAAIDAAGRQSLRFEPQGLVIQPLTGRSTRLLGLPLPPGISIAIAAERLEGWLHPASGAVQLHLQARFRFRIGRLYSAPDLRIDTELSSGAVAGRRHQACGRPLAAGSETLLVGVATVPPSGDAWLDRFLGLPDEALAMLRCSLTALP